MKAKLPPGKHFEKFLQGAESTRQRNDAVAKLVHFRLPLMHRVNDEEFCKAFMCNFFGSQKIRQYPCHFSAVLERAVGDSAHEAYFSAAIHQANARFCQ